MSALDDIAAERIRQIDEKGYDAEHDDAHGTLAFTDAAAALVAPGQVGWPRELGPRPEGDDYRTGIVKAAAMLAAEVDRLDRAKAGVPQAYLPKAVCWEGRAVQCAVAVRVQVIRFCAAHPNLRVFSGLRIGSAGDHRCGYATDLVPLDYSDRGSVVNAATDAEFMRKRGEVAYVEPLKDTWIPGNHHLHVSWKRCP